MFREARVGVVFALVAAAPAAWQVSCSSSPGGSAAHTPEGHRWPGVTETTPRELSGLRNVVAFADGFWSGSVPEGGAGFATLKAMGVRTVISVDGAEPDVAAAAARGLRYIHLPIGYNGFNDARRAELARATRDALARGGVYIHCHHGKHRSAGAAAAVAVSLGWSGPGAKVGRMRVAGTSPGYTGLYACAMEAAPLSPAELEAAPADFPAVSRPADFVRTMVEMDEVFERLKAIDEAGWTVPAEHPDLVPAAEAGRLADLYRLARADSRTAGEPAEFAERLGEAMGLAREIEGALAGGGPGESGEPGEARLRARFQLLAASCKGCHVRYRD